MQTTIFDKTFKRHVKLLKEHLGIREADTQVSADDGRHYASNPRDSRGRVADENIQYTVEMAKDKVKKIIAELKGYHSSAFTKAIETWTRINELNEELNRIEDEFKQEGLREKISALFGAEFEYTTRVVKTVSLYELMLTAQPVPTTDKSVAWSEVYKELEEHLTPELLKIATAIKEKYSSPKKVPVPAIKIKAPELTEGMWSDFIARLKSWGAKFDVKLGNLKKKIASI
jgi:hypothetical protein